MPKDRATPDPLRPVAFILKGYPRLSETFIAQEIKGLQDREIPLHIVSLRHPTDKERHPIHGEITAPVTYLPEYLHQEPGRVFRAWCNVRSRSGYRKAFRLWLADLKRDFTRNRIRRFGQALVLAAELGDEVSHLHAHFLHTPGSVARYAAHVLGRGWTCSAHAKDIWTQADWEKRLKLADLDWLVTCTALNADHLRSLSDRPQTIHLVYHGLDLGRFASVERQSDRGGKRVILSVGRAVEKKGYDTLLSALARLKDRKDWHFRHIGGGKDSDALKRRAADLGLSDRITWEGAKAQAFVLEALRKADIFVLASKIAKDGDRDGLPNVLMEAQSQSLACVATAVSAIPELILPEETGLLVEPEDEVALAAALARLLDDPDFAITLGKAGEQRVRNTFGMTAGIEDLASRFSRALAGPS
ncbi:MAG: glycosyltransferase [Magnetovibrionaceae bacterium]